MAHVQHRLLYDRLLPRLEHVSLPLAALGLTLSYFPFPGGNVLLALGVNTLAIVYFLQAFSPNPTALTTAPVEEASDFFEPTEIDAAPVLAGLIGAKVLGMGAAITLIGMLFKLLFWQGATNLLLVGTGSLVLALLLLASIGQFSRKGFTIVVLGSSLLFVSTETLIRTRYHGDPALAEKVILQQHHPTSQDH